VCPTPKNCFFGELFLMGSDDVIERVWSANGDPLIKQGDFFNQTLCKGNIVASALAFYWGVYGVGINWIIMVAYVVVARD
jgi:hypothetical protein